MANKIDKHLFLNEMQKQKLIYLMENEHMVEEYWEANQQNEAMKFLEQNNLLPQQITSDLTKWRTRNSRNDLKTMNKVLYQCTTDNFYVIS